MSFYPAALHDMTLSAGGSNPQFLATLSHLLAEATGCLDKDHLAQDCLSRARALVSAGFAPVPVPAAPRHVLAPWQATRLRKFIEGRIDTPIRTDELIALTGLSASYFFRAFKGSFGIPPHAYIVRLRIERAQGLLAETDDQLCQIALAVGLNDQAHLSRLFRRLTGRPPGVWRREHRGNAFDFAGVAVQQMC